MRKISTKSQHAGKMLMPVNQGRGTGTVVMAYGAEV